MVGMGTFFFVDNFIIEIWEKFGSTIYLRYKCINVWLILFICVRWGHSMLFILIIIIFLYWHLLFSLFIFYKNIEKYTNHHIGDYWNESNGMGTVTWRLPIRRQLQSLGDPPRLDPQNCHSSSASKPSTTRLASGARAPTDRDKKSHSHRRWRII